MSRFVMYLLYLHEYYIIWILLLFIINKITSSHGQQCSALIWLGQAQGVSWLSSGSFILNFAQLFYLDCTLFRRCKSTCSAEWGSWTWKRKQWRKPVNSSHPTSLWYVYQLYNVIICVPCGQDLKTVSCEVMWDYVPGDNNIITLIQVTTWVL